MGSVVRNYVWCLNDVDLCSTSGNFCTNSPKFSIGGSQCEFHLQFGFDEGADRASVFLCRGDDDDDDRGAPVVVVSFLLVLQSAGDGHVDTYRSTFAFTRSKSDGFSVEKQASRDAFSSQDPFPLVGGPNDSFIIKCETFTPSLTFNHTSADIDVLSEDLFGLHVSGDLANARLVAGDCVIPVHREILSARSPVFRRQFESSVCGSLETPFPAPVVRAVLAFVYSANVARVDFRGTSLQQVLNCAGYYGVSELADLLTPSVTYLTTTVDSKTETYVLRFDCFTTRPSESMAHPPVRMRFDKNVAMAATLFRDPRVKQGGRTDVDVSLENLSNVKSVRVRVYLQDGFGTPWRPMAGERTLEPDAAGRASWRFEHQSPENGKIVHNSLGTALRLRCEARFRLSDSISVSDPDDFKRGGYEGRCAQTSRDFVRSMERLMESATLADAHLLVPSADGTTARLPVHRSVLAARSPVLRTLLEEGGGDVELDLPGEVATALLRYAYTGNLTLVGPEAVCPLHAAAETYGMDPLRAACAGVVAKAPLDLKNVYSAYLVAAREGDLARQESCKEFVAENEDIVFGSARWEEFRTRHAAAADDIRRYVAEKKCVAAVD